MEPLFPLCRNVTYCMELTWSERDAGRQWDNVVPSPKFWVTALLLLQHMFVCGRVITCCRIVVRVLVYMYERKERWGKKTWRFGIQSRESLDIF